MNCNAEQGMSSEKTVVWGNWFKEEKKRKKEEWILSKIRISKSDGSEECYIKINLGTAGRKTPRQCLG